MRLLVTNLEGEGLLARVPLLVVLVLFRLAVHTLNCLKQLFLPPFEVLAGRDRFALLNGLDLELARCRRMLDFLDLSLERLDFAVQILDRVLSVALLQSGVAIGKFLLVDVLGLIVL